MTIPLKTLIEARDCFAMVREAEASSKPLNPDDYRRCLIALSDFSSQLDSMLAALDRAKSIDKINDGYSQRQFVSAMRLQNQRQDATEGAL